MDLIIFSCRARINSFFRQKKMLRVLLLSLGIVGAAFYAWLFSFLLTKAHHGGINPGVQQVLQYANLFLLAIIILRGFFPAYIPKANIIQRIYPVKALQKFSTEFIVELVSPFYFILVNFLILLFLMSPEYTFLHLLQSMLVMLTAHVTLRSLQVFVERRMRWLSINFASAVVLASGFIALQARVPMYNASDEWLYLIVHLASLSSLIIANFFVEQAAAEPKRREVSYSSNARRSLGWRLFKNHKLAKQMILFGLVFKGFFLAVDAFSAYKTGTHIFDKNMVMWIFVGPMVIYTYVFNNAWGFYKNLWLSIERTSGNYVDFLKASLLPLRVPLMMDAVLTFLYVMLFNHQNALFIVAVYIGSVLLLTPFGIIVSIISPKAIKGGLFSFEAKSSYFYNFLGMALYAMLFLPLLHPILYLIYPVLIGMMFFALAAVLKEYPSYKYKLFETLFKTEA
ncbi:hypothetical protein ABID22_003014 [Pontibacter aydingkolensis]|uniref:Membrane protein involved in the export of O-antigen and teichoic acid n=1 Tax=Pontibacter aydingkolensis TaxID=1911536 RepID=A0ABS7CUX0_9BACT|nr:hypothetical protein [Pontibacter aydingkolensis]MBW7467476.1 hypothetical protein [Pontibacter aydingkolensis]